MARHDPTNGDAKVTGANMGVTMAKTPPDAAGAKVGKPVNLKVALML